MRVCFISVEIFAWGKFGGFGRSTRMLGRELARRGVEVTAVVPRRPGQQPVEVLDGIRVLGFDPRQPFSALALFRQADADIYHSQEPSFGTYLAQHAMPKRKHIVTFRDTRDLHDWWVEFKYPSMSKLQVISNFIYEDNILVHGAVRTADARLCAAKLLISKARKKYGLPNDPLFVPSPIPFPDVIQKAERPRVCFIARLDRRKRPQIFFDLARQFPDVQFTAVGAGQDAGFERELRAVYGNVPNLEIRGFIDQFDGTELSEILGESWVMVNTSARESLPTTFVEAAAHGCALLSGIDPDGFSSNFGYHVTDGDYGTGLSFLLEREHWRSKGELGMQYARATFSLERSIERHLEIYNGLFT